jgi:hypothetical protein
MRQYKANLNPLLSGELASKEGQPALFTAYQEFRFRFSQWVSEEIEYVSAASRAATSTQEDADLAERLRMKFARALGATVDFQATWGDSEASDLVGAIFYRVADWVIKFMTRERLLSENWQRRHQ